MKPLSVRLMLMVLTMMLMLSACGDDSSSGDDQGGQTLPDGYHPGIGYVVTTDRDGMRLLFPEGATPRARTQEEAASGGYDPNANLNFDHPSALRLCEQAGEKAGERWTLPTIEHLRQLVSGCPETEFDGPCGIYDDCTTLECTNESCQFACALRQDGPHPDGCYMTAFFPPGTCGPYWSRTEFVREQTPEFKSYFILVFRSGIIYSELTHMREQMRVVCVLDTTPAGE